LHAVEPVVLVVLIPRYTPLSWQLTYWLHQ